MAFDVLWLQMAVIKMSVQSAYCVRPMLEAQCSLMPGNQVVDHYSDPW